MSTPGPPTGPDPQDPQRPDAPTPPGEPTPPPSQPSYPPPGGPSYPPPGGPSYPPTPPPPPGGSGSWPPPPPPSGDPGYQQPFSATDAIGYGWRKFTGNLGQWLLGGLLIFVVSIVFSGVSFGLQGGDISDSTDFSVGVSLADLLVNIVSTIVTYILTAVLYRGALDETEGRPFSLGDTFSRVPIVPVILTSLLVGIGVTIGLVLCILPGLVFAFLTYFALMFVVDRGDSPIDAIRASISLVSANLGNALLLALLSFVIIIAGICLCGLGLFVAYPVTMIATAYAYKRFQDQPVA